jgi:hypothetical protein
MTHIGGSFFFGPPLCICDHLGGLMQGNHFCYAVPLLSNAIMAYPSGLSPRRRSGNPSTCASGIVRS